jgi:hypothetical protein
MALVDRTKRHLIQNISDDSELRAASPSVGQEEIDNKGVEVIAKQEVANL